MNTWNYFLEQRKLKNGETQVNEILLNSMSTGRSKQAYMQDFDCETIALKKM